MSPRTRIVRTLLHVFRNGSHSSGDLIFILGLVRVLVFIGALTLISALGLAFHTGVVVVRGRGIGQGFVPGTYVSLTCVSVIMTWTFK